MSNLLYNESIKQVQIKYESILLALLQNLKHDKMLINYEFSKKSKKSCSPSSYWQPNIRASSLGRKTIGE